MIISKVFKDEQWYELQKKANNRYQTEPAL